MVHILRYRMQRYRGYEILLTPFFILGSSHQVINQSSLLSSSRMACECDGTGSDDAMAMAMPTSPDSDAQSNSTDRLSALPDALLHAILAHLPTPLSARTSLLSRRFRHLHLSSPSLRLVSRHLPPPKSLTFSAMVRSCLFPRDAATHPLHSLLLDHADADVPAIVSKAASLGLRHLTIDSCSAADLRSSIPIIFSIPTLQTLAIAPTLKPSPPSRTYILPSPSSAAVALPRLASLSLSLSLLDVHSPSLAALLSQLPSLQDLSLQLCTNDAVTIASPSLTNLHLVIVLPSHNSHTLELSAPSLQMLSFETHGSFYSLPDIRAHLPSLRKAVIGLHDLCQTHLPAVSTFLAHISHVQELGLQITESEDEIFPFPILLEPGKDPPTFSNLRHLDVTMCFHEHNFGAFATLLSHSPALESLTLLHKVPKFSYRARERSRKDWVSKLSRSVTDNCGYASFRNLHLGQHSKELQLIMSQGKRCTSAKQAHH